jgi:hypothetical protein
VAFVEQAAEKVRLKAEIGVLVEQKVEAEREAAKMRSIVRQLRCAPPHCSKLLVNQPVDRLCRAICRSAVLARSA